MNKQEIMSIYDPTDIDRQKGIEIILDDISNIRRNPKLFKFVIQNLRNSFPYLFKEFYIICYGDNYEQIYNWIFCSYADVERSIENLTNCDTKEPFPKEMMCYKYKINKI